MENREREIVENIRQLTAETELPEKLAPDAMEEMLKMKIEEQKEKKKKRNYFFRTGLAAACCLLVCGAVYGVWNQRTLRTPEAVDEETESVQEIADQTEGLRTAQSYEEVYEYAKEYLASKEQPAMWARGAIAETEEMMVEDAAVAEEAAMTYNATADYSDTNVRQEGVDEADVVKTDGRYLYTLTDNSQKVKIVDTQGDLAVVGEVFVAEEEYIHEFYVSDGQLVLLISESANYDHMVMPISESYYGECGTSKARFYSLQDITDPTQTGEVIQSGNLMSSRMSNGYLYMFSYYYMNSEIQQNEPRTYVPAVDGALVSEDSIYLPDDKEANMYLLVTAVDAKNPDAVADSKAILTRNGELYVSGQHIYWYEQNWQEDGSVDTIIRKVSYQDGQMEAVAKGTVDGYVQDSFCIDEYQGFLRVVTTDGDTNGVYVLDETLTLAGSITGLAEEERVYSARFMGDVGYFVTFRQTDPLFTVELSDPYHPQIVGELKIPGFSEYLHFYGENLLLGVGMNADEETGMVDGMKLSMFDLTDKTDVKEAHVYVMENVYSADILYDYKAALIDVEKNLIGFSGYEGAGETYFVFSYDASAGFVQEMAEQVNGTGYQSTRGVYIDEILYIVKGNIIEAYDLNGYNKVDDLIM